MGKYTYEVLKFMIETSVCTEEADKIITEEFNFETFAEKIAFLNNFKEYDTNMFIHQKMKVDFEVAKKAIDIATDALKDFDDWTEDGIKEQIKACAESAGMKSGQVMFTMRVALTGEPVTPGGAIEMAVVLGKEETLRRLAFSKELIK